MLRRYNGISDEELVVMAQTGDTEAEEVLIRRYNEGIKKKAHIYFIAGADSEDVIQEGMIGLYKAIRSYQTDKEASFRTYAEICISRQILDAIKMAARRKHEPLNTSISLNTPVEGDESATLGDSLAAGGDDRPEDEAVIGDLQGLLEGKGEKLFSKMEQKVLDLYMEGKTYAEIGEELGRNYKAIDNAMQRIRKKITGYIA